MNFIKVTKDYIWKIAHGKSVPHGIFEMHEYFRQYGSINFEWKWEDDIYVAVSTNFRHGSIVTNGRTRDELDRNIKDAILTSFDIPSAYSREAKIERVGSYNYALA